MIPIEALKQVTHIVTHGPGCADGLASTMILKQVYPDAKVTFIQYGTKERDELKAESGMLFCDMTPPENRVQEFVEAGAIVLDHHKGAQHLVEQFGDYGVFVDEVKEPGVSGAVLAYYLREQVVGQDLGDSLSTPIYRFAKLVGVRDTWQRNDPQWGIACELTAALKFFDKRVLEWKGPQLWASKLLEVGPILVENHKERVKKAIEGSCQGLWYSKIPDKHRIVIFQGLDLTSDAAEEIGDKADLVVGFGIWCEDNKPGITYSLRSHTDFDCAKFAKSLGGGGHTKAAGFRHKSSGDPYAVFFDILANYELGK